MNTFHGIIGADSGRRAFVRCQVISIAGDRSVNKQLARLDFEVIAIALSEMFKSEGSVRFDKNIVAGGAD